MHASANTRTDIIRWSTLAFRTKGCVPDPDNMDFHCLFGGMVILVVFLNTPIRIDSLRVQSYS